MALTVTQTRLNAGIWEAVLSGAGDQEPDLQVTLNGAEVPGLVCSPSADKKQWNLRLPIASEYLNDGIQVFLIGDATGTVLTSFTLMAGEPLTHDFRAEIALLRAELDLLKRAFRREHREG